MGSKPLTSRSSSSTNGGRTRAASREEAVERATAAFRAHGFVGTSIQRLVDTTGWSRSSIYNQFGDKNGLFIAALDRYVEERRHMSGAKSIDAFLRGIVRDLKQADGEMLPCLITRSCSEIADLPAGAIDTLLGALDEQWGELLDTTGGSNDAKGTLALAVQHGLASLAAAGVPRAKLLEAASAFQ